MTEIEKHVREYPHGSANLAAGELKIAEHGEPPAVSFTQEGGKQKINITFPENQGEKGDPGPPGPIGPQGPKGSTGATGNGISSISLLSTVGKVKTYRINFTNGTHFDYTVTDGSDGGITIVDDLTSTSATAALSANQGRVLKGLIDGFGNVAELSYTVIGTF